MFRMYDFDGNGLISKDEFIRMLRLVVPAGRTGTARERAINGIAEV
jgi:Ca2+-binding EF-hand superfamily protein